MGEVQLQTSSSSAFATLNERPISLRRVRPPNIGPTQHENRVPLRAERSTKRESKIGLRGIFTKSKTEKLDKDLEESSPRTTSRSASIRASLADFGGWPYKHSSRSEASLLSPSSVNSRSTPASVFGRPRPLQGNFSTDRLQPIVPLHGRVVAAPWNPPPLFQVYPQAVKHATLPACNASVEALARYSETRSSKFLQGSRIGDLEHRNDFSIKTKGDTLKKKQRVAGRNSWEWTSKIFVLVTSGYLLQYAAEGTYNRVPEKILQLTATSAAYASDLIPGRHWVLQVASATDADGNTFVEPKSRRSKLSMRDNRRVSNMLLVFENPESMDDWLAILRRAIEFHGGKKKLSETGKVEAEDLPSEIKAQSSHRVVVVKDRDRFSRIITRDFSYTQENALVDPMEDEFGISSPRPFSTCTIDNSSPTVSILSSDGQRLENLRDSGSSHRFSYMSSGQRTMVTSEGSSPACSPTRASFSSQGEDLQLLPSVSEIRLRPNAAAIVNRRQSMQALISSFEAPTEPSSRPYANTTSTPSYENEQTSAPSVPNFSVPHAISKRFSLNTSMPSSFNHLQQSLDHERNSKLSRKPPPTALLTSRPLSIVIDQPSPRSPRSPNSISRSVDSRQSNPLESINAGVALEESPKQNTTNQAHRPEPSGQIPASELRGISRSTHNPTTPRPEGSVATVTIDARTDEHITRASSSLGSYGARRRLSGTLSSEDSFKKRSSLLNESRSFQSLPFSPATINDKASLVVKSSCSPKRSAPSLRSSLTIDSQERLITARRSMPQLNDGLPPAPPPSCALPPVPQKPAAGHHL
ncbi:hypothetical protein GGS24DRAFT_51228 [Hypoxylon argillaceum]|nr:hypothetical protein GGS24DRAFT_51228 [Hypoxylon argillaceum]KAI1153990.1 hypothetical protein F4825DRAFT_222801 [Nemania diffusa]